MPTNANMQFWGCKWGISHYSIDNLETEKNVINPRLWICTFFQTHVSVSYFGVCIANSEKAWKDKMFMYTLASLSTQVKKEWISTY